MGYREIDLTEWKLSGGGATADSYIHQTDSGKLLKVFTGELTDEAYAIKEYSLSKKIEEAGISTPKALEMVKVGEKVGIIYERIKNKKSISSLCGENSKQIEEFAAVFGRESLKFHSISVDPGDFVSRKQQILEAMNKDTVYTVYTKKTVTNFLEKLEDTPTVLHGDLQSGNLIIANDIPYWIDLGTLGWGNPVLDLGCTYFFFNTIIGHFVAMMFVHMKGRQLKRFWKAFSQAYTQGKDLAEFNRMAKKSVPLYLIYTVDFEDYPKGVKTLFQLVINRMVKKYFK